jgi:hypothetical protein
VTFTQNGGTFNIHLVVWQFWGRAANTEASWTEKSRTLFLLALATQRFIFGVQVRQVRVTRNPAAELASSENAFSVCPMPLLAKVLGL